MTVKELAEFTGKNETTVQRWVKKANCKMQLCNDKMQLQKGHETDFTLDEVEAILTASSLSKDAVSILMQNARASQSNKDIAAGASNGKGFSENKPVQNAEAARRNGKVQDYQTSVAIQSIAASLKALTAMMSSLNNRMSVVECNQKALPMPLDYYTVLAYCKNKGFAPTTGEAVSIGLSCKKMSALRGIEVKKIPDARYGTVNAYHISVLKDVVEL